MRRSDGPAGVAAVPRLRLLESMRAADRDLTGAGGMAGEE
jgi:hypothetical protein